VGGCVIWFGKNDKQTDLTNYNLFKEMGGIIPKALIRDPTGIGSRNKNVEFIYDVREGFQCEVCWR
jgi:hypothetical protein